MSNRGRNSKNTKAPQQQEVNDTQNADQPINGTEVKAVTTHLRIQTVDFSTKTLKKWTYAEQSARNLYYPNRQQLYDLYDNILKDLFLKEGLIGKRIKNVVNKKLVYKAGDVEVPEMSDFIASTMFRNLLKELMWSKFWGISGVEFTPGKEFRWKQIPRKHIKPKWQVISYEQSGSDGISYVNLANVWIVGEPDDLGILLPCCYYVLLKRGVIGDWSEFIEMFGQPTEVFEYEAGDEQTKIKLDEIVQTEGNLKRVLLPTAAKYRQEQPSNTSGNGELQDKHRNAMNQEMAVGILGATEVTTSSSSSGYAQSSTHADQMDQIIKDDMLDLADWLNCTHFINILKSYGLPVVEGGKFEHDSEINIGFLEKKWNIDKEAIDRGVKVSLKYIRETYRLPEPIDANDVFELAQEVPEDDPETEPTPGKKPKNKTTKKPAKQQPKNLATAAGWQAKWNEFRETLADFFAPASR